MSKSSPCYPLIFIRYCAVGGRAASPSPPKRSSKAGARSGGGDDTLIAAPTGSGKTLAAFLTSIDELFREGLERRPARRGARDLRLAAQGALGRHPQEPGGAAARDPALADARLAGEDHRRGAQRRHAAEASARRCCASRRTSSSRRPSRSTCCSPPSARGEMLQHGARGDRRRDPRRAAVAPRRPPRAVARAAGPRLRPQAAAHRPVGHAEADRRGREIPRTNRPCSIVDKGHKREIDLAVEVPRLAPRGGDVGRGLGRRSTSGWSS